MPGARKKRSVEDLGSDRGVNEKASKMAHIEEKRMARTRTSVSRDMSNRIDRALTQRLYLLNQVDISRPGNLGRKFDVLGSTGNVYHVEISQFPSCTCPDFDNGNLCKHILFVYIRVLQCNTRSIIIQKALLQEELASIFSKRSRIDRDVRASEDVMRAYSSTIKSTRRRRPSSSSSSSSSPSSSNIVISLVDSESEPEPAEEKKNEPEDTPPDGDCPICFEPMIQTKEPIDRCTTCRNCIHSDCLRRWLTQSRTCVYCRSDWIVPMANGSKQKRAALPQSQPVVASRVGHYLNIS